MGGYSLLVWIQRDQPWGENKLNGLYHFSYGSSLLIYYPIRLHNKAHSKQTYHKMKHTHTHTEQTNTHTSRVCDEQRRAGDNQQCSEFQHWYTPLSLSLCFPGTCLTLSPFFQSTVFPLSFPFQFSSLLFSFLQEKPCHTSLTLIKVVIMITKITSYFTFNFNVHLTNQIPADRHYWGFITTK